MSNQKTAPQEPVPTALSEADVGVIIVNTPAYRRKV